jgi:hypothetical protein
MTNSTVASHDQIHALAAEWRSLWDEIRLSRHAPDELGRMFDRLNALARQLAGLSHRPDLDSESRGEIAGIELAILKDELHSGVIHEAC